MATIFVYGTLQHPPLLHRLLGRVPVSSPGTLVGWRAAPLAGRVFPGLVPDSAGAASGALLEVTEAELVVLDAFEGPAYDRIVVRVGERPAHAWRLRDDAGEVVLEGRWSLERFRSRDARTFLEASAPGRPHPRRSR